jgi:hypothetical protein
MAYHDIVSTDRHWLAKFMHPARQHRRRKISASICLLVVVLLYAPLAGAAWSSHLSACCTSDQCSIPEHHHHKSPVAPASHMDCGHDMTDMMACSMSCCQDSDHSIVASIAFVLPPVIAVIASSVVKSPVQFSQPLEFPRSIEPLSPPPRLAPAAA